MPRREELKCYFGCKIDGPLHRFPKLDDFNTEKFEQWKSILDPKTAERGNHYISKSVRFCYRHFKPCFRLPSNRLTKNAVPTLNICTFGEVNNDGDYDHAQESGRPPAKRQKIDQYGPSQSNNQNISQENYTVQEAVPTTDNCTMNNKYSDLVTPEDVQKSQEFIVHKEVKFNDKDGIVTYEDINGNPVVGESVLEEAVPEPKKTAYSTFKRIILEEKGAKRSNILPLDWSLVRHESGMPVYVHRATRVCTLSMPYFLGMGSAKIHDVPVNAIPCLAYRRALKEEERQKVIDNKKEQVKRQRDLDIWNNIENASGAVQGDQRNLEEDTRGGENTSNIESNNNNAAMIKTQSVCPYRGCSENNNSNKVFPVSNLITDGTVNDTQVVRNSRNATTIQVEQAEVTDVNIDLVLEKDSTGIKQGAIDNVYSTKYHLDNSNLNDATVNEEIDNSIGRIENIKNKESTEARNVCEEMIGIPENRQAIVRRAGYTITTPRVFWKTRHLTHEQVTEYCKNLFKFKIVTRHFKCWKYGGVSVPKASRTPWCQRPPT